MSMKFRLVAEIAQAHEGSLGQAHAFIDAVQASGVKDIKFQMHFDSICHRSLTIQ